MRDPVEARRLATSGLVDLLDRLLAGGAVVTGDVVIALAGVDLLYLDLKLLLAPAETLLGSLPETADPGSGR